MAGPHYSARRTKLTRLLHGLGLDGILISGESNVRYLTGFTGDSSWLLLSPAGTVIVSDTRFATQLADECPEIDAEIRDAGRTMNDAVASVIADAGCLRVGIESDHLTVSQYEGLLRRMTSAALINTSQVAERLREIKDRWELEQIREAVQIAERGIAVVRSMLRPQLTERQIRYILEDALRDFGADGTAFEPIVGVGATAAQPHAHAGERRVAESPALLIDWGARTFSGYRSDLTRVFFTSRPTKQMRHVYEVVLAAQQAAIREIRPGVKCRDVDSVARDMIAHAGYGKYFGHGVGHGFGLEIHESVRVNPLSEQVFKAGMVVTVEPGIYLPGKFGVRIEDDILVTPEGHEVLTGYPRDFDQAVVGFLA